MANIANLAVSLIARTGKFEKGMARARKSVSRFAKNIGSVTSGLRRFAGAIAGIAVGGTALMVKQQLKAIDSTAKLADVLGFTTQQLTGYQLAAQISGVETGQLNTGLARLQKNIGDAGDGLSTSIRALDKLGLSFEQLRNKSPDEQFKIIADRFSGLNNQIDKSSVLLNLFGRSGLALGKLLENGRAPLERFQEEAKKLGLSFNRIDAAKVEVANDAMTRLGAVLTGAARTLSFQMSPAILLAAERMIAFGKSGEGVGGFVSKAFDRIVRAIARAADFIELLKAGWFAFKTVVLGVGLVFTRAFSLMVKTVINLGRVLALIALGPLVLVKSVRAPINNYFDGLVTKATGSADAISDSFGSAMFDSAQATTEAANKFAAGTNSAMANKFLEDAKTRAEEVTKTLSKNTSGKKSIVKTYLNDLDLLIKKAKQFGFIFNSQTRTFSRQGSTGSSPAVSSARFLEVDLKRVFIGGLSNQKGTVEKEQLSVMKAIKTGIDTVAKNTRGSTVAVTT